MPVDSVRCSPPFLCAAFVQGSLTITFLCAIHLACVFLCDSFAAQNIAGAKSPSPASAAGGFALRRPPLNENRRPCRTPVFVYILHNRRIRIIMFCCLYCTSCIQYVSNLFACVSCSFFRTRDRHAAPAHQRRKLLLAKQTKSKQPKRPCKFQAQQRRKLADTCGDKHVWQSRSCAREPRDKNAHNDI